MLEVPQRSHEQRMAALEWGNVKRVHRAQVKRDLKAGEVGFFDVLDDPLCDTMYVLHALRALPAIGPVKAAAMMKRADVSASKTCAEITLRQRAALAREMGKDVVMLRG